MAFYPDNKRYFEITPFEHQVFVERNGNIESLVEHRKKKFDGEIEPNLKKLAESNPRSNLQNFKFKGSTNKIQELLDQDFEYVQMRQMQSQPPNDLGPTQMRQQKKI